MHAVIFDVDGTLLQSAADDERLYRGAITTVLGSVEFRAAWQDYRHVTDSGILHDVLDDNGIENSRALEHAVKTVFEEMIRRHIEKIGPFEPVQGARKLLKRLVDSADCSVAIATGGWCSIATLKLITAGFVLEHIPMATSDDAHGRVEIMRIARDRIDGDTENITYVGDAVWDQAACRTLGWQFIGMGPHVGGLTDFQRFVLG